MAKTDVTVEVPTITTRKTHFMPDPNASDISYGFVNVSDAVPDETYQRMLDESAVRRMVRNFDYRAVGSVMLSLRETTNGRDIYAVIDGQHRIEAFRRLGIQKIHAVIHTGLTLAEEAKLFVTINRKRRTVSANQLIIDGAIYGDTESLEIERALGLFGFRLSKGKTASKDQIACGSSLRRIYRGGGADGLAKTARALREIWDGDPPSLRRNFVEGMWHFIHRYGDSVDWRKLVSALKLAPYEHIEQLAMKYAAVGHYGPVAHAMAFAELYNRHVRKNERLTLSGFVEAMERGS